MERSLLEFYGDNGNDNEVGGGEYTFFTPTIYSDNDNDNEASDNEYSLFPILLSESYSEWVFQIDESNRLAVHACQIW